MNKVISTCAVFSNLILLQSYSKLPCKESRQCFQKNTHSSQFKFLASDGNDDDDDDYDDDDAQALLYSSELITS